MSFRKRNVATGATPQTTDGGASQETGGGAQNLVIKQANFEELFLQCSICLQNFTRPKILSCGHSFCLGCLKKYHSTTTSRVLNNKFKCPTCRREINITEREIDDLPNDFRIEQMIDLMKASVYVTGNKCEEHYGQELSFYCRTCSVPICRDCPIVDHRQPDGHDIVNLKQVLDGEFRTYEQVKNAADEIIEDLGKRSEFLLNALDNLDDLEETLYEDIDEKFEEFITVLKMRKQSMKEKAHEIVTDQKNRVLLRGMRVKAAMVAMKDHSKNFTESKQSNNVHKILAMNEKMRGVNTFVTETITNIDETNLLQSCKFRTNDEQLLHILTNVGDIEVKGFTDQEPQPPPLSPTRETSSS